MTKHIQSLNVFMDKEIVGNLSLNSRGTIDFIYDKNWIAHGFNISPLDLKMVSTIQKAPDNLFHGLHGIFADSISDGWGLIITDRALRQKFNWEQNSITQLDRLFFVGNRAIGALTYEPSCFENYETKKFDVAFIFLENEKLLKEKAESAIIRELYLSGGSPGGARPKAVFAKNDKTGEVVSGFSEIPDNYNGWIVKFFSKGDDKNSGKIEMAYSDMARDAGIIMPKTSLINTTIENKKHNFFSTERFDRRANNRIHTATVSGLLYATHRAPSISYETIFQLTKKLCNDNVEMEKLFRLMVFNILAHNKDDHSKNFSFRYINNKWELSPAYDLTYNLGINGQHMTDVMGNGNPDLKNVLSIAENFNIKNVGRIVDEINMKVQNFPDYAKKYNLITSDINKSLKDIQSIFFKD